MELNDWDPMVQDYYNAENVYDTGPGRHMPDYLQPGNYRNNSDKLFKLYISGLTASMTESSIRNLFSKFGKIYKISMDKENHYWAILSYYTQQAANNAIAQMNNHPDYGFRVSYKNEKVITDISVGCQFSYKNLNQDTSSVDNGSQRSRESSYSNNMDLPPREVLFCIVCNSKTMGFCTGCDLSFCNQQCMLTGIDRHKNCVKLPMHDLRCLRPDSENKVSIPIYAHDATSLRRDCDVRSFSEDIQDYTTSYSRDHKPIARISNEYYNANEDENNEIGFRISNSNRLTMNPIKSQTYLQNYNRNNDEYKHELNRNSNEGRHRNQNGVASKVNHKADNMLKMNTRQKFGLNDLSRDFTTRNENDVLKNDRNRDHNARTNYDGDGNMSIYIENRVSFKLDAVFKIRAFHLVKAEPFIIAARFVDEEHLYESFKEELNREMNLKPAYRLGMNDKVIVCRGKEKFRAVIVGDSSHGLSVILEDEGCLNNIPDTEQLKAPLSKYVRAPFFSTKMEFMNYEERQLVQDYIATGQPFKVTAKSKEKHLWRVEIVSDGEKELVKNQVENQNNGKLRPEHNMSRSCDVNMTPESNRSGPRSNRQSDGKLNGRRSNDYKADSGRTTDNKTPIPKSVNEESIVAEDNITQVVKNSKSCSPKSVDRRSTEPTEVQDKVSQVFKNSESRSPKSVERRSTEPIDAEDEASEVSKNNENRSPKSIDRRSIEPIDAEDEFPRVSKDDERSSLKSIDQNSNNSEVEKSNNKPDSPYGFTLIEGQWAKVIRTQVEESDGSFYVCDHNEMLRMAAEITKLDIENLSAIEEVDIGLACFAKYVDAWYRAKVTNTDPLEVLFLDFGNYEKIEGNLKKIPQDLAAINALAIKVKLIAEDGISADVAFGDDPNIVVFVVKKGTSDTPWIVSTRELYEVVPVWPLDNRNLFVVKNNDFYKLRKIADIPKPPTPLQCDIESGLMCLCYFEGDGGRARVKKTEPLTVNYIDYGNDEEVSEDELFELPEKWVNIPGMAFKVKLEDSIAKKLHDGQPITIWRKSSNEAFKMSRPMNANFSPVVS